MRKNLRSFALVLVLGLAALPAAASATSDPTQLERQVRHELVLLPFHNLFDNLEFQVNGDEVTLSGQVVRPTTKTAAERAVAKLEGVSNVDNQIEVLPLSTHDSRIRYAVARVIYGHPMLSRYGSGARPNIHIIVNRGDVTLKGVVAQESEKIVAFLQANGVSGVFSVTNDLQVERSNKS